MFLKGLNPTQQKLFLGVAQQLAEADAKISVQERDLLIALSDEMGQQELIPDPDDALLEQYFPDQASRTAVMLEIIGLAVCDGIVAAENRIIKRLQRIFAISEADLKAYKAWVKKFYAVRAEAAEFFAGKPAKAKAAPRAKAKATPSAKAKATAKKSPAKATNSRK